MGRILNQNIFNKNELVLCHFQHEIIHNDINCFNIGENVFLKSNPEVKLVVNGFNDKKVIVKHYLGGKENFSFPPQCLLQYKYASLLIAKRKYKICLN